MHTKSGKWACCKGSLFTKLGVKVADGLGLKHCGEIILVGLAFVNVMHQNGMWFQLILKVLLNNLKR